MNLLHGDDDDGDGDQVEEVVAAAGPPKKVEVAVAIDSGDTDNVVNPNDLPEGVELEGPVGKPFSNASGGDLTKYGRCVTLLEGKNTKVGFNWTACADTRPLQSVSRIAGPEDDPGIHDVMFNNRIGVVMPPGLLNVLLKHIKPVASYPRRGGGAVRRRMSRFQRQGPTR